MLDERKASILRAIVKAYIESGQPVGSGVLARSPGVQVSAATIRNEMAVLEVEGYLQQPHTSAGRIPTDKGYRFFVDSLTGPGPLDASRAHEVRSFFDSAHGAIEHMLHDTTQLLSRLTDYAAVVIGPPAEAATIRSVQLVGLTARTALVVVVLSNAVVERFPVDLPPDITDDDLAAVSARLARDLVGSALGSLPDVASSGDVALDAITAEIVESLRSDEAHEPDSVFVGGVARVASAFDAVDTVRQVLQTLEQQYVVVSLLRDVLDRGLSVAIGHEHGIEPLAACSVIVAPYEVDGEQVGTIGVLGPTRMNYPQALAAVAVVSDRLGKRIAEG